MYWTNPVDGRIILERSHTDEKLESGHPLFRVTNPFDGTNAVTGGNHNALDLGNTLCGENVYAMADGKARTLKDSAGALIVIIKHAEGYETVYAHLKGYAIPTGQSVLVKAGQLIGYHGSTGVSSGCHLHLEVKLNGKHIDPWPLLNPGSFRDVPSTHRFFDAIKWAAKEKLIVGLDGNFYPDQPVTRGQLAVILRRLDKAN